MTTKWWMNWERRRLNCCLKTEIHTVVFSVIYLLINVNTINFIVVQALPNPCHHEQYRSRPAVVQSNRSNHMKCFSDGVAMIITTADQHCNVVADRGGPNSTASTTPIAPMVVLPPSPIHHLGGETLSKGILQSVARQVCGGLVRLGLSHVLRNENACTYSIC
jgi:hypothetical protein